MKNLTALVACLMCVYAPMVMAAMIERKPVEYQVEAKTETVLIEEKIEWTPARVEKEIREVFPENPETMIAVAKCESGLVPDAEGPTQDSGIFQIHRPSHARNLEGIDLKDPAENIRFARKLYDESGLQPWKASRKCWSR